MKAFWWFRDNAIAGMARPGFNGRHWFDLPFEEGVVYAWLGQFSSDRQNINALKNHFKEYGAKVAKYHKIDESAFQAMLEKFEDVKYISNIIANIADKTKCLKNFSVNDQSIEFGLCEQRLNYEIDFLKKQNISTVVALTEKHHQRDELQQHFKVHHFSIEDLNAPSFVQVVELADVIREATQKKQKMAVHCMAGIGRTSTMLVSAHLVLGENLEKLRAGLAKSNPSFSFSGSQGEFIAAVNKRVNRD